MTFSYLIYDTVSTLDIASVIMYVGPVDHETYFPLDTREIAIIDGDIQIVFLHIFEERAERHRDELLSNEANVGFIMTTFMNG